MTTTSKSESKSAVRGWTTDDDYVESIELTSPNGKLRVTLLPYGARLLDMAYEGRSVMRGFNTVEEIESDPSYAGAAVGRVCNRIRDATYDGYKLSANQPPHQLHGGRKSWDKKVWNLRTHTSTNAEFTYSSPHGDQGFPSSVDASVQYSLDENKLVVRMATTNTGTVDTVTNMTLHPYFDLGGSNGTRLGSVKAYSLYAPKVTGVLALDDAGIPTGKIVSPDTGTYYKYSLKVREEPLGERTFDNYFITSTEGKADKICEQIQVHDPSSKLTLCVASNQPGFQMYTPDSLASIAIEPSGFIDAPNNAANGFPSIKLTPGDSRCQIIEYKINRT